MEPIKKIGMKPDSPANMELHDGKMEAGSSAPGQMGPARWGDPMVHENSTESEIIMESNMYLCGLDPEKAEMERRKFNAGALTDFQDDEDDGSEELEHNRNAENQL